LVKSSKLFFSLTTGQNGLIFGFKHPWGKEIQLCSNEVPGITNGHTDTKGTHFYIGLYSKNL